MNTFYFTYGLSEEQPFQGGWTVVEAPDQRTASNLFREKHPDRTKVFLNCAAVYNEAAFKKTTMIEKGNFGKYEQERLIYEGEEA